MPVTKPSLANFSTAVVVLGEDATLRLRTDGSGIAISKWERFRVRVCDFLFRSEDEIAAEIVRAFKVFIETVTREQGREMTFLAETTICEKQELVHCLTGRDVKRVCDTLTRHGGLNWLKNEKLISRLAISDEPAGAAEPYSLHSMLAETIKRLCETRRLDVLDPDDMAVLNDYMLTIDESVDVRRNVRTISERVAATLREKALRTEEQGSFIDLLDEAEAEEIGTSIGLAFVMNDINSRVLARFDFDSCVRDVLANAVRDIPLPEGGCDRWLEPEVVLDQIHELVQRKLRRSESLLTPENIKEFIGDFVRNQQEKLRLIDTLKLPGELKDSFVQICLESPLPMDAEYFEGLRKVAIEIESRMVLPSKSQSGAIVNSWLALSEDIDHYARFAGEGVFDQTVGTFIALSVRLFLAQSFHKPLVMATRWGVEENVQKYVREPIQELVDSSEDRQARHFAETSSLLFQSLDELVDSLAIDGKEMLRNGKTVRLPRFAEIVNSECAALMALAKEKRLPKNTVEAIQDIYRDVFPDENDASWEHDVDIPSASKMMRALANAVSWGPDEGVKPPDVDEGARILEYGQEIARKHITLPIVRKINDDTYQRFLGAHSIRDDPLRNAVFKQERKDIEDSTDLLNSEEMLSVRDRARQKISLRKLLAPFEHERHLRERIVEMGLDARYFKQAEKGVELLRGLAESVHNGEVSSGERVAALDEFRAGMKQLFLAVPESPGKDVAHFIALTEALFNERVDEEIVDAFDTWVGEGSADEE